MALSRDDELDLLVPLHAGVAQQPRFSTFLDRLRARTRCRYAGLFVGRADLPIAEAKEYFSGADLSALGAAGGFGSAPLLRLLPHDALRPGRAYAVDEFAAADAVARAARDNCRLHLGLADDRVVRVALDGADAWLLLARAEEAPASDGGLLIALAPHLRVAVRALLDREAAAAQAAMAADALICAGTGWMLFDAAARLVDAAPRLPDRLAALGMDRPRIGERLRLAAPDAERTLLRAATDFAGDPRAGTRALTLHSTPRVDALLAPLPATDALASRGAVMRLLLRYPPPAPRDHAGRIAALFALPPREAQLAALIADGGSIADGAAALGITLETARNYSKRIFARLGVHGQTELVRLLTHSAAGLGEP